MSDHPPGHPTSMITVLEVSVGALIQILSDKRIQVITSLLDREKEDQESDVAPLIGFPFTYHWYEGLLPPAVGVAVKVI